MAVARAANSTRRFMWVSPLVRLCWLRWSLGHCVDATVALDAGAFAPMWYRGAGTALESLLDIARRAASYLSQSALSARDGMVMTSPWSRPASAASTMSSADITIAAGR